MRIHALIRESLANGPGLRTVLYFQGCGLQCPGCWNPSSHSFSAGEEVSPESQAVWIHMLAPAGVEGITFSGGEPAYQAGDLLTLMRDVRNRMPDLSLGLFSGYTEHELESGNYVTVEPLLGSWHRRVTWLEIRGMLDFACLGRYNQHQRVTGRPLVSSANQRLILYSSRYTMADFDDLTVEVTIGADGSGTLTGFPILGQLLI